MRNIFIPSSNKIIQIKEFQIKTHVNQTGWTNYLGEINYPKCQKCNCEINYGTRCFYGWKYRNGSVRLKINGYCKVCFNCGIEILKSITPSNKLSQFDKMMIGVIK